MRSLPATMAAIVIVAIVAVTLLAATGNGPEAVVTVLGALASTGFLNKLDRVERQANGVTTALAAAAYQDGYRTGYREGKHGDPLPTSPVAARAPYLLVPGTPEHVKRQQAEHHVEAP